MNDRVRVAFAGDAMLARDLTESAARCFPVDVEVLNLIRTCDAFILNLECCLTNVGSPHPRRSAFNARRWTMFRAPEAAVGLLTQLGVTAVSLANNHSLDFNTEGLMRTIDVLNGAGIASFGAGINTKHARAPLRMRLKGRDFRLLAFTDHPPEYAATLSRPGVAFVPLEDGLPAWVLSEMQDEADVSIVFPHWGPNFRSRPSPHVQRAAAEMRAAGAALVVGHSPHTFHAVGDCVLYSLGDFINNYPTIPGFRNDLSLIWVATFSGESIMRLDAVPLTIRGGVTRISGAADQALIHKRLAKRSLLGSTRIATHGQSFSFHSLTQTDS